MTSPQQPYYASGYPPQAPAPYGPPPTVVRRGVPWWLVALACLAALAVGVVVGERIEAAYLRPSTLNADRGVANPVATSAGPGKQGSDSGDSNDSLVLKLGQTAKVTSDDGDYAVTVSNAVSKSGELFFTVDINCTAGKMDYNPLFFTFKTADGTEHDIDFMAEATLHSGTLPSGQKVHGTIAFELAKTALTGGEVELEIDFARMAYWTT